jgi:hypothetical protein
MNVHGLSAAACLLVCAVAACVGCSPPAAGVAVGDPIGSYACVKSGGIDDGVEVGRSLCYT